MGVDTNRKGDVTEIFAVYWLWMHGYEVFRNCGCTGPVDLVALSPVGDVKLIDVKALAKQKSDYCRGSPMTEEQRELGVELLFVDLERQIASFNNKEI